MKLAGSQLVPSKEPRMLTPEEIVILQQDLREALSMHTPEELVAYVESKFDCRQGPFMAYVPILDDSDGIPIGSACHYVVLTYISRRGRDDETLEDHTPKLVAALQQDFDAILMLAGEPKPRLYWRYAPPRIFLEEGTKDEGFKIRTRIAVPKWTPELPPVRGYMPEHQYPWIIT